MKTFLPLRYTVFLMMGVCGLSISQPTITSVVPSKNALNVTASSSIQVFFSDEMDTSSFIADSTFIVVGSNSGTLAGLITYDDVTLSATYNPIADFKAGENITVVLTTGIRNAGLVGLATSFSWSFSIVAGSANALTSAVQYSTNASPRATAAVNIDGDTDVDVIVVNTNGNNISVFKNNGNGTFAAKSDYPVGGEPQSIAAADYDGDGDMDLAVSNYKDHTISILKNDGIGGFADKTNIPSGSNPYTIVAVDIDGDGDVDLAATNSTQQRISVIKNNGNGTFAAGSMYSSGASPNTISSADVDGDGDMDLVVTNYNTLLISIFKNNGNGTLASKVDYSTNANPSAVVLADLDSDGHVDMAVTSTTTDTVSVLRNSGTGTFPTKSNYAVGDIPFSIAAVDIDGDGDLDLVTANNGPSANTISLLKNNGDNSFAAKIDYAAGSLPRSVSAADVDGDGDLDLAVANSGSNNISIFLNTTFPPPVITATTPVKNSINVVSSSSVQIQFNEAMDASSFISDSTIVVNGSISGLHQSTITYDNGSHTVTINPNTNFKAGEMITVTATTGVRNANTIEMVYPLTWSFTAQSGIADSIIPAVSYPTGNEPTSVTSADFNGDGALDLAVTNYIVRTIYVYINNGTGSYNPISPNTTPDIYNLGAGVHPYSIISADVDGDGDMDLAAASYLTTHVVTVLKNNGLGGFGDEGARSDYVTGSAPSCLISTDIDGDGDIDLITANNGSHTISVLKNNGDGTFGAHVAFPTSIRPNSVVAADVDKDGDMDLAAVNANYENQIGTISVFKNNGKGIFTEPGSRSDYSAGLNSNSIASADVDGDGYVDLAVTSLNADSISVFKNNGTGGFGDLGSRVDYVAGAKPRSVIFADGDGDGDMDMVVANYNANTISFFLNNGNGTFAPKVDYAAGIRPCWIIAADVEGDEDLDFAVTNNMSNSLSVYKNTYSGTPATGILVRAKVFLQGPYSVATGTMSVALATGSLLPLSHPYNVAPFNYPGIESVDNTGFLQTNSIVDWVLVELRSVSNGVAIDKRAALLKNNGILYDLNGKAGIAFTTATPGNYYIVIKHRNHLAIMSSAAVSLPNTTTYNFTLGQGQAFGTNPMKNLTSGVFGMWAGDANSDGIVKYNLGSNDRTFIYNKLGNSGINTTMAGYHLEDLNMDGVVKYNLGSNDRQVIYITIGTAGFNTSKITQVPAN